jgi:sec-independent protein translocase protein TatB
MFDIGVSEIAVIAVIALVVIGPERLPKVARTVGALLGRAQRYVNDVKAEVNREMELEELRKLQTQMQDAARGIQEQVSTAGAEMQSAVHDMEKQLNDGATPTAAATSPAEPAQEATADTGLTTSLSEPPPDAAHFTTAPAATEPPPPVDKPAQSSLFPEHTIH